MSAKKPTKSYQDMQSQLNEILDWFEGSEINLDEAVDKYEQAMKLIEEMETYLKSAQNKIKKIAVKFDEN